MNRYNAAIRNAGGGGEDNDEKDGALQRLVFAMRGYNDEEATLLAQRVISSQIGFSQGGDVGDDYYLHGDQFLSSTLRRIARKSNNNTRNEIEGLYKQIAQQDSSLIPPKLLVVLTKLMGKKIRMPTATTTATTTNARVQQQQQHNPPATPLSQNMPIASSRSSTPSMNAAHHIHRAATSTPNSTQSSNNIRNNMSQPATDLRGLNRNNNSNNNLNTISNNNYQHHHHYPTPYTGRPSPSRNQPHPTSQGNATSNLARLPHHHQQLSLKEEQKELETEESLLLRECLYSLQGIDGERIRYYYHHSQENNNIYNHNQNKNEHRKDDRMDDYEGIRVQSPALSNELLYSGRIIQTKLGSGAIDALRICGEAGWLYNQITSYINQVQHSDSKGVVARAFAGTLTEEIRDYHSLLTQYESKLSDLTLRQIMVTLRMPTNRLRIMALLTDGLAKLTGGHLLSGLYKHTLHGDSRHVLLVQSILKSASSPWYDILFLWTTQGVLSDPHGEFFVQENFSDKNNNKIDTARNLWKDKYSINKSQIPTGIIDPDLVKPAFNVGKGINFIRQCLHDGQWTMQLSSFNSDQLLSDYDDETITDVSTLNKEELGYRYHNGATSDDDDHHHGGGRTKQLALKATLARAADLVHTHILKTLKQDFNMMEHLWALKQFLFLGQGDFFSSLMDGLFSEFSNEPGVAGIYKHSLLGIVESALRSTNAKYMPQYVLDRLQVELLLEPEDDAYYFGYNNNSNHQRRDSEDNDQRTVWDIFMLDYQLPDPLITIVHPEALEKYKSVFSLLFSLKKVEFMLNYTWRQNATIQHALHTHAQYTGINIATSRGYAQASFLLRKISILRQSMNHLIVNLKSYLMFEVLEGGWRRLELDIFAAKSLDEVIIAHDRYINGIVRKSLVRVVAAQQDNGEGDDEVDNTTNNKDQNMADQIQTLLVIANEFCTLQENLFSDALMSADIATQKRAQAEGRSKEGQWGFDYEHDIKEDENFFGLSDRNIIREVMRVSQLYNDNALELLRLLSDKVNNGWNDDMAYNPDVTLLVTTSTDNDDVGVFFGNGVGSSQMVDYVDTDLDPQRFLLAQLDHNNYYGQQETR